MLLSIYFEAKNYFQTISTDLWLSLMHVHTKVKELSLFGDLKQLSIDFLINMFGKISFLGYSGKN